MVEGAPESQRPDRRTRSARGIRSRTFDSGRREVAAPSSSRSGGAARRRSARA